MFTSFESSNTPGIRSYDLSRIIAGGASTAKISLEDDCAPVQYFVGGANTTAIRVYLPSSPVVGKQITIKYDGNTASGQLLEIWEGVFTTALAILGYGQTMTFVYAPQSTSYNSTNHRPTSWVRLFGGGGSNTYAANGYVASGQSNNATNSFSAILGGQSNSISGASSTVGGGIANLVSSAFAATLGGSANFNTGTYATIGGGQSNVASASHSFVGGGQNNTASASHSFVGGGAYGTTRGVQGLHAFPACNAPVSSSSGVTQSALLILGRITSDATTATLTSNSAVAGSTANQLALAARAASYVKGSVIAAANFSLDTTSATGAAGTATLGFAAQTVAPFIVGQTIVVAGVTPTGYDGTYAVTACTTVSVSYANATTAAQTVAGTVTATSLTKAWVFEAVIMRASTVASSIRLVSAVTPTVVAEDTDALAWAISVTADTTNGALKVEATGAASTTIRWVCKLESTEVTF